MDLKHTIITALNGLKNHKSRSVLTILGIVIGVAAIIIVMALGKGAEELIVGEVSAMGAETAVVLPGTGEDFQDLAQTLLTKSLTEDSLEALKRPSNVPNLIKITPMILLSGQTTYLNNNYRPVIIGGESDFFIDTFNIYPAEGIIFEEEEVNARSRVALIGSKVKDELFNNQEALGEFIRINDQRFRVIGIFPSRGQVSFFNLDDLVLIPYTTAQSYLSGADFYDRIVMVADDVDNVDKMVFDATATLREAHNINYGEDNDFYIQTQQGLLDQITAITSILTAFLVAVVGISLVVGGIGIMNIMLVSVTERTKEIGLRKALGATREDILKQFLLEAIILTSLGGLVGVILGGVVAWGISVVLTYTVSPDWAFAFPIPAALLGVGVSALIGLIFGIYPAWQAAEKSPIEALRYE
ncbi:MAG: ABC transporter permease [Patescibacteria group bacterium]